ncbi:archaeosortase/exosortase family protein [Coraliomargarita sp. SDUM461004]|uniref:Archaeosortase/exosortase family protein n=1 Tax=Thalassobacterium sedimentorum TaxID=3041258 RepID=A0ABU1AM17_9BACT|nr:archaeosortase/exosortase family protein [Coraliomargarita sp. SDUM461004]MDQ8195845.1 archaeosortase/exosortase family protein [Coraliomargarita sp. SDUM461004]
MPIRQQLVASFHQKYRQSDFWINCVLFGLLGASLWPVTMWIAQTANDQSRILNALIVLAAASILLVRFGSVTIERPLELNLAARRALLTAYLLLGATYLTSSFLHTSWLNLLIIPAYCCALAAAIRFIFGEGTLRLTRTVAGTLCVFLLLSIFMQPLDWPLRSLAGQWSGYALERLGQSTNLGLIGQETGPPMLILLVNEHPFHVASECNGFGVILTSLLLALMLAIHQRLNMFKLGLNVLTAAFLGFAFNTLRIVIIVLLAPSLMEHYYLMHEIIGGLSYWACLIVVWFLFKGPTRPEIA